MAQSIEVFLLVSLLCCMVTASLGGIPKWQKAFSKLENKVYVQEEEIKSLHQIIEQLVERLEPLETKCEFDTVQVQPAMPFFTPVSQN